MMISPLIQVIETYNSVLDVYVVVVLAHTYPHLKTKFIVGFLVLKIYRQCETKSYFYSRLEIKKKNSQSGGF